MSKAHKCAAKGCDNFIALSVLFCRRHWFMVPKHLRDTIWSAYTPGQETDLSLISDAYMSAWDEAVEAVAEKEGHRAEAAEEAG